MSEEATNNMNLNTLSNTGTAQNRKRVGRGIGSGTGKTAGRGHKGQKSRSGGNVRLGFEGGQMPLQMRLPKFGFTSRVNNSFKEVNIKDNKVIGKSVKKVKIFGNTEIESKITVEGIPLTKGAKASIEKAGGKIVATSTKNDKPKTQSKKEDSE